MTTINLSKGSHYTTSRASASGGLITEYFREDGSRIGVTHLELRGHAQPPLDDVDDEVPDRKTRKAR